MNLIARPAVCFALLILVVSSLASAQANPFERSSRALMKGAKCVYDVTKTSVGTVSGVDSCGGNKVSVCFAVLKCEALVDGAMEFQCVATDGKCPKSPEDCRFGKNAIAKFEKGASVIESVSQIPSKAKTPAAH